MRARLPISASRLSSHLAPALTPITTIRPPVASAFRLSAMLGAPTSSRITSNGPCSAKPSGAIASAPSAATSARDSSSAHGRRHARAARAGELDRRGADPAGAAVHEQALAGAQLRLREERVVGGREHLGQPAGGGPLQGVGDRHQLALVHDAQLGLRAAADDRHHAVAPREALRPGRVEGQEQRPRPPAPSPGCPAASRAARGRARAAASCRRR